MPLLRISTLKICVLTLFAKIIEFTITVFLPFMTVVLFSLICSCTLAAIIAKKYGPWPGFGVCFRGKKLSGVHLNICSRHEKHNPSLVLVQTRMTHPYITERLLMRRKESNQTNKNITNRHFHEHKVLARKVLKWISFISYKQVYNYEVKVKFNIPYKPTNYYRSYGPFICLIWFFTSHQQSFS